MARFLRRDRVAIAAGLLAPLFAAAVLLPFRASWPNTDVALVLVIVVVAAAATGNRVAGAVAALSAAAWFDFFFTLPYDRFMLQPKQGSRPSRQARLVAVTLADQAGRALGSTQTAPGDG